MAKLRGIVRVDEESDWDACGGPVLTGLFLAQHVVDEVFVVEEIANASLDDAVAWGRVRAEIVTVCVGERQYFSAGVRPAGAGCSPLKPGLRLGRRRTAGEEWHDRRPDDPLLRWRVYVDLDMSHEAETSVSDEAIEGVAQRAGAEHWVRGRVVGSDGGGASASGAVEYVGMEAIFSATPMILTPPRHQEWSPGRSATWRLRFAIDASTAPGAMEEILARCADDRWYAAAMAVPITADPCDPPDRPA